MNTPGVILLISCYELGHRPAGLTRPLHALEAAGFAPDITDIAVEPLDAEKVKRARFIGISVPMHTALRLGVHLLHRIRQINPEVSICMYGLYATLNADYLLSHGVDFCLPSSVTPQPPLSGGQVRDASSGGQATDTSTQLVALVQSLVEGKQVETQKTDFYTAKLPPLEEYAQFEDKDEVRTVGYTETTHGCKHLCTHCPIPPVYKGKFFAVNREIVLDEIQKQVAEGAMHITFGDPDFLNGPMHGLRILRTMHEAYPNLTFDFTTKVEHILKHRKHFPEFAQLGCRFVISAVESLSDTVLTILEKHHTRADVETAIDIVQGTGIALRPTWVPFTPWTTLDDYLEIFQFVDTHRLVYHVDPVQYAVRLLIPPGSYLRNRPETKALPLTLDEAAFSYTWVHPDARMDELHKTVNALVENDARAGADTLETFYRIWSLAADMRSQPSPKQSRGVHQPAPRITEAWFC
ncbi:MAG: CUAEP/CCAEP-tail radical SAM protein [Candidatus Poribacteria bacterium]|nr:CUAEP/CCAEP-tail radical SAM protein [Candidatus Poribacteria bacterium]